MGIHYKLLNSTPGPQSEDFMGGARLISECL